MEVTSQLARKEFLNHKITVKLLENIMQTLGMIGFIIYFYFSDMWTKVENISNARWP